MTTIQPTAPDKLWTPANIVTLIRICLVPVFVLAILSPWPEWVGLPGITMEAKCVIAAGIFILISCTDWIDGYLARSRGEVTDFGKFMDPLADKILVTAALIALVELAVLPGWPVLIILAREFIVSGIRMVAASKGTVIAASWYGKAKTVFQIIAIVLFLLKDSLTFTTAAGAFTNPMFVLSWTVMVIALILTVMSMLDYLVKARHLLKGSAGAKTAKAAAPSAAPTEIAALQKAIDEQALEICDMLVRSGAIDCVIVDSVAALVPRAEIEGEMGDTTVGLQARLMSQALRKLAGSLSKSNTTCIFINQLREKIGVMFGNPETTTGGRALKFFSSVRIDIRRIDSIKQNGDVVGNRVRAKVVKNKVAPPFRQAEFDLMYGEGISREGCIVDMAVECGVAKKSGAWYTYGEERLGQGREAAKQTLKENPDLREELENKIREAYEIPVIERPAENESFTPAPKSGKKK